MAAFEPYAGERKGLAWDVLAGRLRADEWVPRDEDLIAAMTAASGMLGISCEQLITSGINAGWIRQAPGPRIRVTAAGVTLRHELRRSESG